MCYRGMQELRGVLYSRILCYEFAENKKWKNRLELDIKRAYKKLQEYWKRDSDCLCHGNCGNFLDLGNRSGENERIWDTS